MFNSNPTVAVSGKGLMIGKILVGIVLAVIVLMVLSPFTVIPAGHRGVVTTFGKVSPEVLGEQPC